jgi:hypothetical protein
MNKQSNNDREFKVGLHYLWSEDSRERQRRRVWHVSQMFLRNAGGEATREETRCGW